MKAAALTLVAAALFAVAVLAGRWPGGTRPIAVDAVEMVGPSGAVQHDDPAGARPPLALDALRVVPRPVERADLGEYHLVGALDAAGPSAVAGRPGSGRHGRAGGRSGDDARAGVAGQDRAIAGPASPAGAVAGTDADAAGNAAHGDGAHGDGAPGDGAHGDGAHGDGAHGDAAGGGTGPTGQPGVGTAAGRPRSEHGRGGRDHRGTDRRGDATDPPTQGSTDPGTGGGGGASAGPPDGSATEPSAEPPGSRDGWSGPGRRGSSGRRTPYGR